MASDLFSLYKINEYRNNPDIIRVLGGVQLLNYNEFHKWFSDLGEEAIRTLPKRKASMSNPFSHTEERLEEEVEINNEVALNSAIQNLTKNVCQGIIQKEYVASSLSMSITSRKFDLLVAVAPGYQEMGLRTVDSPYVRASEKMKMVVGFIIVQKGECETHPNAWAVNLICVRSIRLGFFSYSIKGSILLGAYLYCIKLSNNSEQLGLLELADGYLNVAGFFSYTKMGFDKNTSIISSDPPCFNDISNLPMSVNLIPYTPETIIGLASGSIIRPLSDVKDDTGFFSLGYPDRGNKVQENLQLKIGENLTLLYKLKLIENTHNLKLLREFLDNLIDYHGYKEEFFEDIPDDMLELEKTIEKQKANFLQLKSFAKDDRDSVIDFNRASRTSSHVPRQSKRLARAKSIAPYGGRKSYRKANYMKNSRLSKHMKRKTLRRR